METIELELTHEDTDTHRELALHIDGDFCGDFVVPEKELEYFIQCMGKGFGDKLVYSEK